MIPIVISNTYYDSGLYQVLLFYLVMAQEMKIFIQVAPARDVSGAKFTEHFVFLTVGGEREHSV